MSLTVAYINEDLINPSEEVIDLAKSLVQKWNKEDQKKAEEKYLKTPKTKQS